MASPDTPGRLVIYGMCKYPTACRHLRIAARQQPGTHPIDLLSVQRDGPPPSTAVSRPSTSLRSASTTSQRVRSYAGRACVLVLPQVAEVDNHQLDSTLFGVGVEQAHR